MNIFVRKQPEMIHHCTPPPPLLPHMYVTPFQGSNRQWNGQLASSDPSKSRQVWLVRYSPPAKMWLHQWVSECVNACACVRACMCVCVCVCVRERERERERGREQERERERERERESLSSLSTKPSVWIPGQVKQTAKSFPFGTCVNSWSYVDPSQQKYRDFLHQHFNWAVLENALKWTQLEWNKVLAVANCSFCLLACLFVLLENIWWCKDPSQVKISFNDGSLNKQCTCF